MNFEQISNITYSLIIAKADIDFNTDLTKREHVERLEKHLLELLK